MAKLVEIHSITDEICNLITNTDISYLRDQLIKYHPYNIALALVILNDEDRNKIYSALTNEEIADILSFINSEETSELVENVNSKKLAAIINEMEPDDAADLISEFTENKAQIIYNLLDADSKQEIKALASYPENTAGTIMTSKYIKIESGSDIKDIMKLIVKKAPDVETISTSFVVDYNGYLLGTLDLKKIIITKSPCTVDMIMNTNYHFVEVFDNLDIVTKIIRDYDVYDLPVVDRGILKGIITMDDALESLIEEAEVDYAKLAGLTDYEKQDQSIFSSVKKRFPWLFILLILDLFVSVIISSFDYLFKFSSLTVLVLFQPIILGLAGNSGTQSLAVTIRKISQNELERKKRIVKHLTKEIILGISSGILLGILGFVFATIFLNIKHDLDISSYQVGLVVGISIAVALIVANLMGALIPVLLYKIKVDPAVASGPFITTINDILSIVIYFTLATILIYSQFI